MRTLHLSPRPSCLELAQSPVPANNRTVNNEIPSLDAGETNTWAGNTTLCRSQQMVAIKHSVSPVLSRPMHWYQQGCLLGML